jgi:hypothetical protein
MGAIHTLLDNIVSAMKLVNDGVAAPDTHYYFDHVWLGMPNRLPMGDHCVAIVEATGIPDFDYKMCTTTPFTYEVEIAITIANKGQVSTALSENYDVTNATLSAIAAAPTFSGGCMTTYIENVQFGDVALSEDQKNLVRGSRIIIRCPMN